MYKKEILGEYKINMATKPIVLAVAGKGGVGKTSLASVMVKLLVEAYPDKRI